MNIKTEMFIGGKELTQQTSFRNPLGERSGSQSPETAATNAVLYLNHPRSTVNSRPTMMQLLQRNNDLNSDFNLNMDEARKSPAAMYQAGLKTDNLTEASQS